MPTIDLKYIYMKNTFKKSKKIFGAIIGDRVLFTEDEDYNDWLTKTYYASVDIKDRLKHEMPDLIKVFSRNHP